LPQLSLFRGDENMRHSWLQRLLILSTLSLLLTACAEMRADRSLSSARTINALMDDHAQDEFHIVLVHGIRTADRNTWVNFRGKLCEHLAKPHRCANLSPSGPTTEKLLLGGWPKEANVLGDPIWPSEDAWAGSQPFVDHYAYQLENGQRLILDEVNWWPLALALKCRFLVKDDTDLVGFNQANVTNCTQLDAFHFGWFSKDDADALKASIPQSGGAPILNRGLKTDILDWGISDAVLSLGTMKDLLRKTIRCGFDDILVPEQRTPSPPGLPYGTYDCDKAADSSPTRGAGKSFVMVSHSLGSFLLLDTFAAAAGNAYYGKREDPCGQLVQASSYKVALAPSNHAASFDQSLCAALNASSNLYFFANQFPLLELGRAQGLTGGDEGANIKDALSLWAGSSGPGVELPRQVLAFSDPGDLLTFKVPKIGAGQPADIYNAYPENDVRWLGVVERPDTAHTGYSTNDKVLKVMFGK
jgi:hypothetical protein